MITKDIKIADLNELQDVKNFMLTALKDEPLAFSVNYEEYAFNSSEWWHSYLNPFLYQINSKLFICKDENKIIGMVGVIYDRKIRRSHLATIVWFYVDKEYRNQGIGRVLMDKAMDDIMSHTRIKKINLLMNETQKTALEIYKKYGFKVAGTLEKEMKIGDDYYNEYILEKLLI